jgi:hypothetical protein
MRKIRFRVWEHPDRKEVDDLMERLTKCITVIAWENERAEDSNADNS